MPPWPSRLLSSGTQHVSAQTASSNAPRIGQEDPDPYPRLHGVPTLSPTSTTTSPLNASSAQRVTRHGRSVSHPFPSLFGGSKKTERRNDESSDEARPDINEYHVERNPSMHLPGSPGRKGQSQSEADFVTGNCATCDSTVRWPRYLDVYRCTVCLMVNDLKHNSKDAKEKDATVPLSRKGNDAHTASKLQRKAPCMSLNRTRKLIDQCVLTYLRHRVDLHKAKERTRLANPVEESCHQGFGNNTQDKVDGDEQGNRVDATTSSTVAEIIYTNNPQDASQYQSGTRPRFDNITKHPSPNTPTSEFGPPPSRSPPSPPVGKGGEGSQATSEMPGSYSERHANRVFRQLENYIQACMNDCECFNASFIISRPPHPVRSSSETSALAERPRKLDLTEVAEDPLFEVDAKTLLLGDIGENGTWWTGERRQSQKRLREADGSILLSDRKLSRYDWNAIFQWYDEILSCGRRWRTQRQLLPASDAAYLETAAEESRIEEQLAEARYQVQRNFLKTTENLLRRPGQPLKDPEDCRFLLILLSNPLLYPHNSNIVSALQDDRSAQSRPDLGDTLLSRCDPQIRFLQRDKVSRGGATGQHSGIVKRILGLLANRPLECQQVIIAWLSRISEPHFRDMVDLVGGFVSYRLNKNSGRKRSGSHDPIAGLIPNMSGPGAGTSAHLHAALGVTRAGSHKDIKDKPITYGDDWQVRVAARFMSFLFSANSHWAAVRHEVGKYGFEHTALSFSRQHAYRQSQLLPTSAFYNTMLDYSDLIADFETWESRRGKFSFCQYPMFLSIWAKIRIMEHDARRQMEVKARDAFFTSIMSRKAVSQYLVLKVRRDCLVDDSLRSVSEVVGTGEEEIKKSLRIEFVGEEGVDAGGLRKEWFLLLVREVFDPDHGLFVYDEDSQYCYFNPNSFETSDQFFLVGVLLGLAIYNSTILDVALPPFAFRKLLASAPTYTGPTTTALRPGQGYTLDDLAEWRPSLARGLRQLLDYDGNVQESFCRDFVADVERYGETFQVDLCPNGSKRPVTNSNRREFVDLYVHYLLDTAVARQYEPFKRGFFTVCGGNALSLFRPEEIELLVRGSDEPLDVGSLRAVAVYENWSNSDRLADGQNHEGSKSRKTEPEIVIWFWDIFKSSDLKMQRKLLTFITGSDRIPAMGTASLVIKITCITDDYRRFPVARTCFNMLGLHRYRSKQELESKLWRAVLDSEGFGLK